MYTCNGIVHSSGERRVPLMKHATKAGFDSGGGTSCGARLQPCEAAGADYSAEYDAKVAAYERR